MKGRGQDRSDTGRITKAERWGKRSTAGPAGTCHPTGQRRCLIESRCISFMTGAIAAANCQSVALGAGDRKQDATEAFQKLVTNIWNTASHWPFGGGGNEDCGQSRLGRHPPRAGVWRVRPDRPASRTSARLGLPLVRDRSPKWNPRARLSSDRRETADFSASA